MINRNYTWIDDNVEHTEEDERRAKALAQRWSAIKSKREERSFRRQWENEAGEYDGPEPCEDCEACEREDWNNCAYLKGIEERQSQEFADEQVEIDIIEEMLGKLGARMMRPYEHWNEDEAYMQYMEEGRFGERGE